MRACGVDRWADRSGQFAIEGLSTEDKVRKQKWDVSGSTGNHIIGQKNFFPVKPFVQHTREDW